MPEFDQYIEHLNTCSSNILKKKETEEYILPQFRKFKSCCQENEKLFSGYNGIRKELSGKIIEVVKDKNIFKVFLENFYQQFELLKSLNDNNRKLENSKPLPPDLRNAIIKHIEDCRNQMSLDAIAEALQRSSDLLEKVKSDQEKRSGRVKNIFKGLGIALAVSILLWLLFHVFRFLYYLFLDVVAWFQNLYHYVTAHAVQIIIIVVLIIFCVGFIWSKIRK